MKKLKRISMASSVGLGIIAAGLFASFALNYGCLTLAEDVARKINRDKKNN